jgi:hypothetical protein
MALLRNCVPVFIACMTMFLCSSCLTTTLPKTAAVEGAAQSAQKGTDNSKDAKEKSLFDKWELQYQVNDKGVQEKPRESTRTLIEFFDDGKVVFDRTDKDKAEARKSRTGRFTVANNEISITDDAGNTVKWPYQVSGDTLVLVMPEVQKKFYWRRVR